MRTPDLERCGLISGPACIGQTIHPITNCAVDPRRAFSMAPRELIAAFARMEAAGESLTAIYHSHPHGRASPSASDVAQAHYRDAGYLIGAWGIGERGIGARGSGCLQLRGFRWTGTKASGKFLEVGLEVVQPD